MALTKIKADGLTADLIDETKLADNSIDSEHYNDGSIDNAHLADDAVGVAELSATGTASSSTFLRGDNSWAAVNTDLVSDTSPQLGGYLASNGHNINIADDDIIVVGSGNDLQISHSSNLSHIRGATANDIKITSANNFFLRHADTDGSNEESMITANGDGAVELYYDNGKTFETVSGGNKFHGYLFGTDDAKIYLGASNDLQIYHDGSDSIIKAPINGGLILESAVSNEHLIVKAGVNGDFRAYVNNGTLALICNAATQNTELRCGGTKKFETTSTGAHFTVAEGEVDIYSTGSGTQHSLRLLNSDASADNKIGMYFGPANNIAGAYIQAHSEADFTSTANRQCGLKFGVRNGANFSEAMSISKAGAVTKSLNPAYCARSDTNQNHSNGDTINPGDWNVSSNGFHNIGSHFNTSNSVFTAPVAGRYLVSMQYTFWYGSNDSSTDGHQLQLCVNNSSVHEYFLQGGLSDGAEGLVHGSAILSLSANDNVRWKHNGYGGTGYYDQFLTFGYLIG